MELEEADFGEHGIIYVTQEKDKPVATEWTNPATEELLKILKKHYAMFANGKFGSKRRLYENCSIAMKKKGYKYAPTQCENKWKSLKRRYLTTYERSLAGKDIGRRFSQKKQMFDEDIEYILKYDKPMFKKELEESRDNLNIPPGFNETREPDTVENEDSDDSDDKIDETDYTQSDEKLVHMILKGSDDEDNKNNVFANHIEYLYPEQKEEKSFEEAATNNEIVKEMRELKKTLKKSVETNTNLLKTHNATYEQLLIYLDTLEKKEEEKVEIKRKKLERQGDILQQMKIQNSLLAKVVQKLANNNNNNNNNTGNK